MRASPVSMPETRNPGKRRKQSSKTKENVDGWRDHESGEDETIFVEDSGETDDSNSEVEKENITAREKSKRKTKKQGNLREQTKEKATSGIPTKQPTTTLPRGNTETKNEGSGLCPIFFYVAFAISAVALAIFTANYLPEEIRPEFLDKINTDNNFNYPKIFENRINEIQKLFPNQTERFWRIVRARSLAHLRNKKPMQPLVILLGAPPSAHAVVNCLAKKLAWCLDPNVSPSNFIDGTKYNKEDGHNTKKILDDELMDIFQRGVRSALVMHLEQLPPPSPLLFYKYCDNDEAPYKHAGIIFTVYLPEEPNILLSPVEAEGSIETFLSDVAWSKYPYESDSISALLSRIADTVALVSHESDDIVQSVCNVKS